MPAQDMAGEREHAFLRWTADRAKAVGLEALRKGRAGGSLDFRIHTERAVNYKLRATWLTPEVIRATARLDQLRRGLSDEETLDEVSAAESAGDTVFLVEVDPKEGSGVVPNDWACLLQPVGADGAAVGSPIRGRSVRRLRRVRALAGVRDRDYAYDRFWMVFRLVLPRGEPVIPAAASRIDVVVRIQSKEEHMEWSIPASIRRREQSLRARTPIEDSTLRIPEHPDH